MKREHGPGSRRSRNPKAAAVPGPSSSLRQVRGLRLGRDTVHATHGLRRAGQTLDPRQGARVAALRAARRLTGAHGGGGHAASAPGRGLPEAAAGPEPPTRPSRPIGSGVSPADAAPRASPPCARSAVSNSLHCPAPPRSRPSPSSQPFTPPNRRGRTQEGPALRGAPCKASSLPTAAPGGSEAAWQPAETRLRSTPPCGRGQ